MFRAIYRLKLTTDNIDSEWAFALLLSKVCTWHPPIQYHSYL
jgi:hypothetical protein